MAQRPNRFPSEAMTINPLEGALIGLALAVAWAAATIAQVLLVPLVALLLTLAGWRPRPVVFSVPSPEPPMEAPVSLERSLNGLTVVELRGMARQAGLKGLARTGRRAELLAASLPLPAGCPLPPGGDGSEEGVGASPVGRTIARKAAAQLLEATTDPFSLL